MGRVDVDRYLDRIGFGGWVRNDLIGLAALQRAHLTTVPFENLDVYYRTGVEIGADWALAKILDRRRGGWCFELNTGFFELLRALGFDVSRRAAEVLLSGHPPETPDHLALTVAIDGRRWLVDVGFGDAYCRPLALDVDSVQDGESRPYRLRRRDGYVELEAETDSEWRPQYRFRDDDVDLDVFEIASERLQTRPGLRWTEARFATRLYGNGRVTLLHDRLKLTAHDEVTEEEIDEDRWHDELERWFGMSGFDPVER